MPELAKLGIPDHYEICELDRRWAVWRDMFNKPVGADLACGIVETPEVVARPA